MSNGISNLIQADLASLTNAAQNLASQSVAPAAQFAAGAGDAQPAFSFAQSMKDAVHKVNDADANAAQQMSDVDSGKSDDLVGAMLSSQEASLSFSMLMQVRNKVMGAVDELIKLPL
ncbi:MULTISPECIES: flagellar hook-basal body complex protein FliE [unclassified Duganella]|uniref:flagellar hook-basal body complex protein FliE n=1 Tax=Duganella TaxID=75654 RepID=UPI000E34763B|nr:MULTISPECIES: flagellar hook-basal body complex protein FliE [unclassified Duganella]RFP18995.1 flagellar hook-basal body complex protein FliE [Duganella sp. BJB475]RFP35657.1 flagellar hook-basal body complex protein FliE [Duganella sp. BJB476]